MFAERTADVDYGNAAMFTRMLIEDHGVAAFRAMLDRDARAPADFDREFADAFGEPLDVAWQRYISEPGDRCTYDSWFCDERRPIELPFETTIECDHPDALGFDAPPVYYDTYDTFDFPYNAMRIFHLDLDAPRTIRFEIANADVEIGRCGSCQDQQPLLNEVGDPVYSSSSDSDWQLRPGTWAFIVHAKPEDGSPRFGLTPLE